MNRPVRTGKDFDEARARILEAAEKEFRRVGYASGSGRLSSNSGRGTWSGYSGGARCSGIGPRSGTDEFYSLLE
jgi:hypothetical protein